MRMTYTSLYNTLQKKMKESRFKHSKGVADTAALLAERFDLEVEDALITGIYHDSYRYVSDEDALALCRESGIEIFPEEVENPMLLHGAVAALHFREDCGDVPDEYLAAVRHHTLGHKEMGKLGALIYIADYIEPGRKHLSIEERGIILSEPTPEAMIIRIMDMQRAYFEREGIREADVSKELYEFLVNGGKL